MGRDCRSRRQGRLLPCVGARLVHVGRNAVRLEGRLAAAPDPGELQMIDDDPGRRTVRVSARRPRSAWQELPRPHETYLHVEDELVYRDGPVLGLHAANSSRERKESGLTLAARPSRPGNAPLPRPVPTTAARQSWAPTRREPRLIRYRIGHLHIAAPTSGRGILAPPQPRPEDLEDPFGTALCPDPRGGEIGGGGFSGGYRRMKESALIPESYVRIGWWLRVDLNHRPQHYECRALTN